MEYLFTFQNTHDAIRAEKALEAADVAVYVMSLPSELSDRCGIGLRIESKPEVAAAQKVLAEQKIAILEIFTVTGELGERKYTSWKN
ncbi:DUF3343 domain-containing protein [Enterococcus hirae]|jgi:hypothetical protein|nr:DUF3343 domain-containing protein [Enterococcaceae bacterium]MCI1920232.1 DUF3343 domain-containing protein [Enterococcaceae bacterium]MDM8212927.1 DUF3343 domain-containing protein [Enterococcus hirae]